MSAAEKFLTRGKNRQSTAKITLNLFKFIFVSGQTHAYSQRGDGLRANPTLSGTILLLNIFLHTWERFKSKKFGFPRFKKFGRYQSFLFPQFKESPINDGYTGGINSSGFPKRHALIKLPKIGQVEINLHRPIPEGFRVKGVRIVSRARGAVWYAVVTIRCDVKVPEPLPFGRGIGVDIGLESYLVTSDNFRVEPARFFRDLQSRLKVLQRKASRKKKSKNWERASVKVAKLHHQIANARKNFHFQTSHLLCDQADMIFVLKDVVPLWYTASHIEDINFADWSPPRAKLWKHRRCLTAGGFLGKQMLDGGFGQFRDLLSWVCWKRGKYFAQVDHKYTSQICPECNTHTGKKELKERIHRCPECSYSTERDHASGRVILNRGLENIVRLDESERKQSTESVLPGIANRRRLYPLLWVNRRLCLGKCYVEISICED